MGDMDTNQGAVEKTVVAEAAGAEATVLGTPVTCPVCGTENNATEKYCGDCGFLLSSTLGEAGAVVDSEAQAKLAGAGREFLLREGENAVGRMETDILLEDSSVSRKHALLVLEDGGCWVEDLGSTNGTFVDGKQVANGERVEVPSGAELKFGSSVLILELPEVPAQPEEVAEEPQLTQDEPVEEVLEPAMAAPEPEAGQPSECDVPMEEAAAEEEVEGSAAVAHLASTTEPVQEFAIVPGANTLGRRNDNAIVLADDSYVSGAHAEIIAEEGKFSLVDVGSTNGTVLNGTQIEPNERMPLAAGDEITVGRTTFKFEPVEVEEPPDVDEPG